MSVREPADRLAQLAVTAPLEHLNGFRVIGRHGYLGTVVDANPEAEERIVFRGGISDALVFRVPMTRVSSISASNRTVTLDVDIGDFTPRAGDNGTVELHLGR